MLDACQTDDRYTLDAVLSLGMRSEREPLLTRTIHHIALPRAELIQAAALERFSVFFKLVMPRFVRVNCARSHDFLSQF